MEAIFNENKPARTSAVDSLTPHYPCFCDQLLEDTLAQLFSGLILAFSLVDG